MSYLDVPRIHFAGAFTANPSTINNSPANYWATGNTPPRTLDPSWNAYGSAAWTVDATVTSVVDSSGTLHTSGDIVGAAVQSVPGKSGVPAKLVDLDVDQQARTQLFGLYLQVTPPDGDAPILTGYFGDGARLLNLWPGRIPQSTGDNVFGGAFQSVLTVRETGDVDASSVAGELLAGGSELSIRISVYGYVDDNTSPSFTSGRIVGTVGRQGADEPRHMAGARFLNPTGNSQMYFAPAKLDEGRCTLTFDLGNSVPDQAGGGPPVDLGKMQAAILGSAPEIVGDIEYSEEQYLKTAGVAQIGLTDAQAAKAAVNPIAILTTPASPVFDGGRLDTGPAIVSLAESSDGVYVEVDLFSVRLEPEQSRAVPI